MTDNILVPREVVESAAALAHRTFEDGLRIKLRAALEAKPQEPIAKVVAISEYGYPIQWLGKTHPNNMPIGTLLYAAPFTIDKSVLKRLVQQVFGEGWRIVGPTEETN